MKVKVAVWQHKSNNTAYRLTKAMQYGCLYSIMQYLCIVNDTKRKQCLKMAIKVNGEKT